SYAYKGIFGKYEGKFSLAPYSTIVKEYGDLEHRDIWEFPLNLSDQEIYFLLLHLWELDKGKFKYYFLDENCSFQLLSLIEAVRPYLNLTEQFSMWTIPGDTIKALADNTDLLGPPVYRPSLGTLLTERVKTLSTEEIYLIQEIINNTKSLSDIQLFNRDPQSAARILEIAADYLLFYQYDTKEQTKSSPLFMSLLRARSRLPIKTQRQVIKQISSPKQFTHSGRLSLGVGREKEKMFWQIDLRPAYYDRFDPPAGHRQGAYFSILETSIKIFPNDNILALNQITLLKIYSLPPYDPLLQTMSWKFKSSIYNNAFLRPGLSAALEGGIGLTKQLRKRSIFNIGITIITHLQDSPQKNNFLFLGPEFSIFHNFSKTTTAGCTISTTSPVNEMENYHIKSLLHYTLQLSSDFSFSLIHEHERDSTQFKNQFRLMGQFYF
ncbi:MAG: DUF4105 domain-containing protein, partial [Desulfobulbaceae bacterium]|nr:DUF4105 domain-containing protein [Desulfobulbaceae bacterium]